MPFWVEIEKKKKSAKIKYVELQVPEWYIIEEEKKKNLVPVKKMKK